MEVAKGISNTAYQKLDLTKPESTDWATAIDIFERRFSKRFIEPANLLIDFEKNLSNKDKCFGFTIVAIDCLLIETLACFYKGLKETPKNQNEVTYVSYLTNPDVLFSKYFDNVTAQLFYREIRCGILHQSETKNASLIKAWGPVVKHYNGSIIINREALHKIVKMEFNSYITKLKDPLQNDLRNNFKTKMDHICR
jgi:hypothetical protein